MRACSSEHGGWCIRPNQVLLRVISIASKKLFKEERPQHNSVGCKGR